MKKLLLFISLIFCIHTFSYASFPVSETENPKNNTELNTIIGLEKNEFKLVGVLILFNNLLQSLFKSQILT